MVLQPSNMLLCRRSDRHHRLRQIPHPHRSDLLESPSWVRNRGKCHRSRKQRERALTASKCNLQCFTILTKLCVVDGPNKICCWQLKNFRQAIWYCYRSCWQKKQIRTWHTNGNTAFPRIWWNKQRTPRLFRSCLMIDLVLGRETDGNNGIVLVSIFAKALQLVCTVPGTVVTQFLLHSMYQTTKVRWHTNTANNWCLFVSAQLKCGQFAMVAGNAFQCSCIHRLKLRGAWRDHDPNGIFAHCSLIFYFLDIESNINNLLHSGTHQ